MGWLQSVARRFGKGTAESGAAPAAAPATDWRALGNAALGAGNLAEAARCYEEGLRAHPDDPLLHLNLGYVRLEQGQAGAAGERLVQALALQRAGDDFIHDAHFLLGRAHAAQGRIPQALEQFDAAARAKPGFLEPLQEAVRLLAVGGRHAEALPRLDSLCGADPRNVEASVQRFDALLALGRFPQALAEAERTLALTGPHAGALSNVAAALEKLGRIEEALERLAEALRIEPGHLGARVSQVALLTQALRLGDAEACAREGLRLDPQDADLHWNLALVHLLRGEFAPGWREHEWRLRVPGLRHKVLQVDAPFWAGEDLAGRTILLHGEQGFGDNIQFVRLVPQVAARAGTVLLRLDRALQPLLADLPANCRLLPADAPLPRVDCHAPLMSLPAILQLDPTTMGGPAAYLRADPARTQAWRERLAATPGLKVGIAWSGNPTHANDHNRSLPLATFRALAVDGARYFTVQPQLREGDRELLAGWPEAMDTGRELRDFGDTAALVAALDVVVTVDTSVAHLAGALGKPVWILLPQVPDWRWMLERRDSPWYPTARLYRQPRRGDWDAVMAQVRDDLAALATQR